MISFCRLKVYGKLCYSPTWRWWYISFKLVYHKLLNILNIMRTWSVHPRHLSKMAYLDPWPLWLWHHLNLEHEQTCDYGLHLEKQITGIKQLFTWQKHKRFYQRTMAIFVSQILCMALTSHWCQQVHFRNVKCIWQVFMLTVTYWWNNVKVLNIVLQGCTSFTKKSYVMF